MVGQIGSAFGLSLMSMPQDQTARGVERHATPGDEAEFRVLDLALAAFAAHLPHALDDVQPALHVGLREVAAGSVDRELAAERDAAAAIDEGAGLALAAEAGMLEPEQHRHGEVVVELRHVDVPRRHAGHAVGVGDAVALMRQIPPFALAQVLRGMALAHAPDRHRPLTAIARALGRGHDDAYGAVADQAAI